MKCIQPASTAYRFDGASMNWDTIDVEWQRLRARLRRLWGKLIGGVSGDANPNGPIPTLNQGVLT